MMRRRGMLAIAVASIWAGALRAEPGTEDALPLFVGQSVCLSCHGRDTHRADELSAKPCSAELPTKHERSYLALSRIEAESIAQLSGSAEPPTATAVCLDCHATGTDEGRRWWASTFRVEDGVQCEACHGPGGQHCILAIRAQYSARNGAPPSIDGALAGTIRRADRSVCIPCHVEKPSHVEVLRNGYRASPIDRMYRTPVALTASRNGNRLYVACERANLLLEVGVAEQRVLREVQVGKRPCGVALDHDEREAFVADRLGGTLTVVDLDSFRVTRTIPIGQEPHAVVIDPGSDAALVVTTGDNGAALVDAGSDNPARPLLMGSGPWGAAIDPQTRLAYVTNVRPTIARFRDAVQSELTVIDLASRRVHTRLRVPEANMLQGVAWVPGADVAVFTLMRTKNLIPTSRLAQGWVITCGIGIAWPDGRVDQVLLDEPGASFPDPMDVAATADGRWAIVTSGGANEVAVVDVGRLLGWVNGHSDEDRATTLPNFLGSAAEFVAARIPVGRNPRGVTTSADGRRAFVANALDDTISIIDLNRLAVEGVIDLGGPTEVTELRRGERLFHGAGITFGNQFSCRSCHPDGHTNGLAFDIEADGIGLHPVDNRTLRGIFDTPPFKWEGTNPTMHRQCGPRLAVFFTRLAPFSPDELDATMRYICTIEQPPNRHRRPEGLTVAQRRGKQVFERTTRNDGTPLPAHGQCAGCHNGAYRTNRQRSRVGSTMWLDTVLDVDLSNLYQTDEYGELGIFFYADVGIPQVAFDAPHLRHVVDSPPYLHNGASPTLEEIWTRFNMVDDHGITADLTRQQMNDLIAYLKSL